MIDVKNLTKTYDLGKKHQHTALTEVSLTLPETGFVCILGESGCGKTTLLNAIGGLDTFDSGKLEIDGVEVSESSKILELTRNGSFGYIFQNYYLLSEHSVAYNVYLGLYSLDVSHKEKLKRVKDALIKVDMYRYRKRIVGELSGGQQQRVAIARAIARAPRVIFADEPTGNLDEVNTVNICTLLKNLSKTRLVVMVTHEKRIAEFFADRIITVKDGRIDSDRTEWERGTLIAEDNDTVYTGDYSEEVLSNEKIDLRLLTSSDAAPVNMTLVVERDRVIIKINDERIYLSSNGIQGVKIIEGTRPSVSLSDFTAKAENAQDNKEAKELNDAKKKKSLPLKTLWYEARGLNVGKKLKKFGTGLFIILLTAMICFGLVDYVTIASIDREDFITSDSHVLDVTMARGSALIQSNAWNVSYHREKYVNYINSLNADFDLIPTISSSLKYLDTTFPQLDDNAAIRFTNHSYADFSRVSEEDLIFGRLPTNDYEIVVDRWVLEKALNKDGILQNMIPGIEYFIGKNLSSDKSHFTATVVGICDKGEPSIYMSKLGLMSVSARGIDVILESEYNRIVGEENAVDIEYDECLVVLPNAGDVYRDRVGKLYVTLPGTGSVNYVIADVVEDTMDGKLYSKIVIDDAQLENLYLMTIAASEKMNVWCKDKNTATTALTENLPFVIHEVITIGITDSHKEAYDEYLEKTEVKLDAKIIVTASVILLSAIMLFFMQRAKIRDNMETLSVYRLLGISRTNVFKIFTLDTVITTALYSIPTVFIMWIAVFSLSKTDLPVTVMRFPLSLAIFTVLIIFTVRLIMYLIPLARLMSLPPARLASKNDF